jgi:hypothetical protein
MITQSYKSLRAPLYLPSKVYTARPDHRDRERAKEIGITPAEFVRRDTIVRQKWIDCKFHVAELLVPINDKAQERYGNCLVEGICKSYYDFPPGDKWPDDDDPYILLVSPQRGTKDGGRIICTADFFKKAENGC